MSLHDHVQCIFFDLGWFPPECLTMYWYLRCLRCSVYIMSFINRLMAHAACDGTSVGMVWMGFMYRCSAHITVTSWWVQWRLSHRCRHCWLNCFCGADQRKQQSSTPLAFMWGTHRWPVNSPQKCPVKRKKCFHLMTSLCNQSAANFQLLFRGSEARYAKMVGEGPHETMKVPYFSLRRNKHPFNEIRLKERILSIMDITTETFTTLSTQIGETKST